MFNKVFSWLFHRKGDALADSFREMKKQDEEMQKAGETLEMCTKKVRSRTLSLKATIHEPQQFSTAAQLSK